MVASRDASTLDLVDMPTQHPQSSPQSPVQPQSSHLFPEPQIHSPPHLPSASASGTSRFDLSSKTSQAPSGFLSYQGPIPPLHATHNLSGPEQPSTSTHTTFGSLLRPGRRIKHDRSQAGPKLRKRRGSLPQSIHSDWQYPADWPESLANCQGASTRQSMGGMFSAGELQPRSKGTTPKPNCRRSNEQDPYGPGRPWPQPHAVPHLREAAAAVPPPPPPTPPTPPTDMAPVPETPSTPIAVRALQDALLTTVIASGGSIQDHPRQPVEGAQRDVSPTEPGAGQAAGSPHQETEVRPQSKRPLFTINCNTLALYTSFGPRHAADPGVAHLPPDLAEVLAALAHQSPQAIRPIIDGGQGTPPGAAPQSVRSATHSTATRATIGPIGGSAAHPTVEVQMRPAVSLCTHPPSASSAPPIGSAMVSTTGDSIPGGGVAQPPLGSILARPLDSPPSHDLPSLDSASRGQVPVAGMTETAAPLAGPASSHAGFLLLDGVEGDPSTPAAPTAPATAYAQYMPAEGGSKTCLGSECLSVRGQAGSTGGDQPASGSPIPPTDSTVSPSVSHAKAPLPGPQHCPEHRTTALPQQSRPNLPGASVMAHKEVSLVAQDRHPSVLGQVESPAYPLPSEPPSVPQSLLAEANFQAQDDVQAHPAEEARQHTRSEKRQCAKQQMNEDPYSFQKEPTHTQSLTPSITRPANSSTGPHPVGHSPVPHLARPVPQCRVPLPQGLPLEAPHSCMDHVITGPPSESGSEDSAMHRPFMSLSLGIASISPAHSFSSPALHMGPSTFGATAGSHVFSEATAPECRLPTAGEPNIGVAAPPYSSQDPGQETSGVSSWHSAHGAHWTKSVSCASTLYPPYKGLWAAVNQPLLAETVRRKERSKPRQLNESFRVQETSLLTSRSSASTISTFSRARTTTSDSEEIDRLIQQDTVLTCRHLSDAPPCTPEGVHACGRASTPLASLAPASPALAFLWTARQDLHDLPPSVQPVSCSAPSQHSPVLASLEALAPLDCAASTPIRSHSNPIMDGHCSPTISIQSCKTLGPSRSHADSTHCSKDPASLLRRSLSPTVHVAWDSSEF